MATALQRFLIIARGNIATRIAQQIESDSIRVVREWGSDEPFAIYTDPDYGRLALDLRAAELAGVVTSEAEAAVIATPDEVAAERSARASSEAASLADEQRARQKLGSFWGDIGDGVAGVLGGVVNGLADLLGGAAGTLIRQHPVVAVLGVTAGAVVVVRTLRS